MLLGKRMEDFRKNNLDLIRFIAAAAVIFSHATPLVLGPSVKEPLVDFTNGQSSLGAVSVAIFFIISGFLIVQSYERSANVIEYFKARVLRIFPALIICVLITAFIIGAIMTNLTLIEYFSHSDTYSYLVAMTTLNFLSPTLPGVFENNIAGNPVNGSLWTLKYEFICYVGVAFLGVLGLLKKKITVISFILCVSLMYIVSNPYLMDLFRLSCFFLSGVLFYQFRNKIPLNGKMAILSVIIILVTAKLGFFVIAIAIFGAYLVFYLSYHRVTFENFAKKTDFSYGIYIYAWPIQQTIVAINPTITVWENSIYTLIIVMIISYFSWRFIEKPALKLKKIKFEKLSLLTNTN